MTAANATASFADRLLGAGFDFFTGVPDSTFKALFGEIERRPDDFGYVPAVSENVAVGVATGAYLGGRRPVIVMQNTGLALAINPLASLALIYRIPVLLLIGWRGHDGTDSPEHRVIGTSTLPLLESLKLPYFVPDRGSLDADLARAVAVMASERIPCALVCRPGVVA
ncbi:MAG: sulfopyruvate decarboxylase subunit alpha [Candidatus Eremiobacteraeota bacterium]|nr:sulfopyruvate decarboxylase subunit alpha [Candidatus Eremiobacteraeota bacterium]